MCDGSACTRESPTGTFYELVRFLTRSSSNSRSIILHGTTTSSVLEMTDFSLKTCLAYLSTSAATLAVKQSVSALHPRKRRCHGSSKHVFSVANIPNNRFTTSSPGLGNRSKRSSIQRTFSSSEQTIRLFFYLFFPMTGINTLSVAISRGIPSISSIQHGRHLGTLPYPS